MIIIEFKHTIGSIRGNEYHARGIYFFGKISFGLLYPLSAMYPEKPYQRYIFAGNVSGHLTIRILWFGFAIKGWYYE